MATAAQLVTTLHEATGVPIATLTDIDRKLTKAGLRAKAGRGFSAAHMSARDAANLLTSLLASEHATDAVAAVERYARTRCDQDRSSDGGFGASGIADLASLPERHSFVDALTALITSATAGSLGEMMSSARQGWTPLIEVSALTRVTRARIHIRGLVNGATTIMEYTPTSQRENQRRLADARDLEQSRRISGTTVLAIAELLKPETPDA